jgi:hypothetical protein
MQRLTSNIDLYSKLLLSVGQQGRGIKQKQPLQPLECGRYIKQLMDEENEDRGQVSERLGLGRSKDSSQMYKKRDSTQVTKFLQLLNISEKSQDLAGWGWEGHPKIPFSVILKMVNFSHDEQDKILQTFKANNKKEKLTQLDVQKIKKCMDSDSDSTIDNCIEKIMKLKVVNITNLVVCEMHDKLNNFIKSHDDYEKRIIDILKNNLDGDFYSIDTTDILITISMDQNAFTIFHEQQLEKGVSYSDFLNSFLEEKIG